ncbi:TonB-dependent receptor [Caulobacter endophyticus]|uniref:TonB-dependent receptor n=1 Tax=Caulobacter endophyticus TaxID=2172652 RepID=A0A2T9KA09_9CAUL|nr:TonB-dependent receptor [Caulobacter endophyticus]PVM92766.1 TonB-dependent receptor [Caulobacter endophyticus]
MGQFQGLLLSSAALTLVMAPPACAADINAPVSVKIQAGPLDAAILSLASQAQVRILFSGEVVAGKRAAALEGRLSARQALEQMLAGTGITVATARPGVLVLKIARQPVSIRQLPLDERAAATPVMAAAASRPISAPAQADEAVTELSEIVVGTHIRGVKDGPSPVVTLDRSEIDRGGYATVADAVSALPQAFGGTTSDDASTTGSDPTTTNANRATGANLRGLGADATLVLINGRRMAGAGLMGDFADMSSIPLAAVARVEVLLDGASALYGSDAVGGVINVVMRERYEGLEARARIGGSTRGDLGQRQLALTAGRGWDGGSLLLSGEYQRRNGLMAVRRDYAGDADLRRFDGTDHRLYYSQPATVLGIDPVTFSLVPIYAVPSGQDGTSLKPADFLAGQRNLANWRQTMSLLPTQERGSVYIAASQDVGSRVTLSADARYSDRRYTDYAVAPQTTMVVGRNNPYFVSPNGAATHYLAYSFLNETAGLKSAGEVQSRGLSLSAKVRLPGDWRLEAYVLHAEEIGASRYTTMLNSAFLSEALGNTPDNPATAYSAARDGYFNPFIGAGRNKQAILDFVTSGWETRRTIGRLDTASVMADGALFRLPAGAVRLAVGAQLREEHLKTIGLSATAGVTPVANFSRFGDRRVSAIFAEARAPLFGPDNRRTGLERLDLSIAVRREHYEGGATSTVPKLGLVWSPVSDWNLKATYGESFRAPSLGELTDAQRVTPVNIAVGSGTVLTLLRYGGNPDLQPETAKSWTTGLEYAPQAHPEIRLNATLWDTRFQGRIGQPAINNLSTVLTAPDLAPFRQFISPTTNTADLALVKDLLKQASSSVAGLYAPEAYLAIADARYVNTGDFKVRGLDLTGTYGLSVGGNPIVVTGNLSWLLSYKRKITAAAQGVELAGTAEYPADLRARVSATWSRGPYSVTGTLNHVGDLQTVAGSRIQAQTTADLQAQFTARDGRGPLKGLVVAVTVQNLFDKDPPFYDAPVGVGYDPANYDPAGRVVALQLTKAW